MLNQKLLGLLGQVIDQNRAKVLTLLRTQAGPASIAALRDDSKVETVASFLHGRLPRVAQLAIPRERFTQFVLTHRERLVEGVLVSYLAPDEAQQARPAASPPASPRDQAKG